MDFQTRKLYCLILFYVLLSQFTISQTSFKITLKDSIYDNLVFDAIELPNEEFIIAGMRNFQPDNHAANVMKVDANGNLIRQNIIRNNGNSSVIYSLVQISSNRILLSGGTYSGSNGSLWICIIDSDLNLVNEQVYLLGSYSLSSCKLKIDYQSNILVFGVLDSLTIPYSFVFKLSSNLDSISCRIFNQHWSEAQDLVERTDHKGYYFLINGFISTGSGKILSLDTNFNVSKITYLTDGIGYHGTLKFVDSTHLLVCGERAPAGNFNKQSIGVQLYDTNFNLIHYTYYGKPDTAELPALFRNADFSNPLSVFIGGTSNFIPYEFVEVDNWYRLNNIDTAFNLNWERYYGGDGNYVLYGILATHDGGCLMYGTFWDFHNITDYTRYIRLIKVSKDGLLSDENGKPSNKAKEVILYPNPGTDKIIVETGLKNLMVNFFDMTGTCVVKKYIQSMVETLDVSELSTGIYFYRFTRGDRIVDSGKWIKK